MVKKLRTIFSVLALASASQTVSAHIDNTYDQLDFSNPHTKKYKITPENSFAKKQDYKAFGGVLNAHYNVDKKKKKKLVSKLAKIFNPDEVSLQINVASYHYGSRSYFDRNRRERRDFNEFNPGLGLDFTYRDVFKGTSSTIEVDFYENSYERTTRYALAGLKTQDRFIDVGIRAGVACGGGCDRIVRDRVPI